MLRLILEGAGRANNLALQKLFRCDAASTFLGEVKMNRWSVGGVSVQPLEAEDSGFFGINQTQTDATAKTARGAFYVEVWSHKKTTRLAVDLDRGLPPADSYEPHLIQARDMPATNVWVNCFCTEPGTDERLAETWHEISLPDTGWAGHMVVVSWSEGL